MCDKNFKLCKKVIRVLQVKQKTKDYLKIRAISRINKTTSTLFRYQKAVPVGPCHDVRSLSYDNHLYKRTRLNQSIESFSQNRKETTRFALIHQKFFKKSHLCKKKLIKCHFAHNTILYLHNIILYHKEYFTILSIGQVSSCLQYPFLLNITDYADDGTRTRNPSITNRVL